MIRVTVEGTPKEIAALVDAIQEQREINAIKRKGFQNLTTEDFARLAALEGTTDSVCTGKEILG